MSRRYRVGLSYSSAILERVQDVAAVLASLFGKEQILFDRFHEAEFASVDLATWLPGRYRDECDLVVAIVDGTYNASSWTGLEWNACYSIHKDGDSKRVMLLSIGNNRPPHLQGLDGTRDVADRRGSEIAGLILERLAINEGRARDYYTARIGDSADQAVPIDGRSSPPSVEEELRDKLYYCRRDRNAGNRRRAIASLTATVDALPVGKPSLLELRLAVWREALAEARRCGEYARALSGLQSAFDLAFATAMGDEDHWHLLRIVGEAAVDISQTAPGEIEVDKVAHYLGESIKRIGRIIGLRPNEDHVPERRAELFAMRSKCRRALSSVHNRRTQRSRDMAAKVRRLRQDALQDARRAKESHPSEYTLHEYALALFAVSTSSYSPEADAGMEVLAKLARQPENVLASYEYVRQLLVRHAYADAVNVFAQIAAVEDERRRFAENLTHFVRAIRGLYYAGTDPKGMEAAAVDAITWLEEAIATGHHRAREIVDYCFLLAVTGNPIDKFTAPLKEITDNGSIDWSIVGELSFDASRGKETLREALLLGLDDARIWNDIGTIYVDFAHDTAKAVVYYDEAIHHEPRSPIFYFNKAKALARSDAELKAARRSLEQARGLASSNTGWFQSNRQSIDDLQQSIAERLKKAESGNGKT